MTISAQSFLNEVEKFKNDPYVYGAAGPNAFDCSGLVQYSLEQLGLTGVPRTSETQWSWVQHISKSQLQPGDLVFAQFQGDDAPPGHVGIYVGGGNVYSAEDPAQGIGTSSLASWGSAIYGYGRIPGVAGTGSSTASTGTSNTGNTSLAGDIFDWITDPVKGAISIATSAGDALTAIGKEFASVGKFFDHLIMPETWIRLGAVMGGGILFIVGFMVLMHADEKIENNVGKVAGAAAML